MATALSAAASGEIGRQNRSDFSFPRQPVKHGDSSYVRASQSMNIIFRRSAPTALILIVILVVVTLAFLSNRLFHNLTNAVEQNQFDLMRTIVRSSLKT